MHSGRAIRILEADSNKRGDLFARLIGDLFLALGYGPPRLNVHKSGRELDLIAIHRTEQRMAVAECKAQEAKIGGDDINKFVGVLDAERRKAAASVEGYFISLSGFTETAIEQERGFSPPRIILLNSDAVRTELTRGRIVCSEQVAAELAGRCAHGMPADVHLQGSPELLGHPLGWIWAVYLSQHGQLRFFTLIHADGHPISRSLAEAVIRADSMLGGAFRNLEFLAPGPASALESEATVRLAREKYFAYLAADFGAIELSGLPTDQDVGSRRFPLEDLFVPIHLSPATVRRPERQTLSTLIASTSMMALLKQKAEVPSSLAPLSDVLSLEPPQVPGHAPHFADLAASVTGILHAHLAGSGEVEDSLGFVDFSLPASNRDFRPERRAIGAIIAEQQRIAVLGEPGAGKSTLLKRLAIAYAFPERRKEIDDQLPPQEYLPITIRCRQLGDDTKRPILDIIGALAGRAELEEGLHLSFLSLVRDALRGGSALLLIDGLDEIPDEGARVAFVQQLRLFLATYPTVALVLTSREPGFRTAAGILGTSCAEFRVAPFNDADIRALTIAWHRQVRGQREAVTTEANALADAICATDRVRRLAQNPLLLTTLLLVKRWVGRLPTRRSVLYAKAIEVLLMTWNVEGHEPLEQEEIVPQLAYIAHSMMKDSLQRVSSEWLRDCLVAARREMPEILSFAKLGIPDFLQRVESRSSLLVLSGHEVENGKLVPQYEFRHLTFQEYLAATAVVHGYYRGRTLSDTLVSLLAPYLTDDSWQEVIALAAVLSGRGVQPFVEFLLQHSRAQDNDGVARRCAEMLGQCILDECLMSPEILNQSLTETLRHAFTCRNAIVGLAHSKYSDVFRVLLRTVLANESTGLFAAEYALAVFADALSQAPTAGSADGIAYTKELLKSDDTWGRVHGTVRVMMLAQVWRGTEPADVRRQFGELADVVAAEVGEHSAAVDLAAAWTLAWLGHWRLWAPSRHPDAIAALARVLVERAQVDAKYAAAWALSRLQVIDRGLIPCGDKLRLAAARMAEDLREDRPVYFRVAGFVLRYYARPTKSRVRIKHRMKAYFGNDIRTIAYAMHVFPKSTPVVTSWRS